jgi:hypothetical protein
MQANWDALPGIKKDLDMIQELEGSDGRFGEMQSRIERLSALKEVHSAKFEIHVEG